MLSDLCEKRFFLLNLLTRLILKYSSRIVYDVKNENIFVPYFDYDEYRVFVTR